MFKKDKEKNNSNKKIEIVQDTEKVVNIKFTILAIIAVILFSAVLAPIALQNDTFYTIKIGELIVNTGKVDMMDHFSWHEGLPYSYPHWLYDVMIYSIYHIGGFTGIFISTVVLSAILGVSIYLTNKKISKNRLISFVITLGAMFLIKDYITARAQLVTFILLELEILCIENFLSGKKIMSSIGLILISTLIANMHCAVWPFFFVLFLPYIGEYICSLDYLKAFYFFKHIYFKLRKKNLENRKENSDKLNEKKKKLEEAIQKSKENEIKKFEKRENRRANPYKLKIVKNPAVKWLIIVMIICAFTGLLTPIGNMPYVHLYKLMQGNSMQSINEHQPLTLINDKPLMIILGFIIIMLIFTDLKIRFKDLFMIGGLAILMFMTRRQTSMFIIFGSAIFANWVSEFLNKYDKNGTMEFQRIMTSALGTIATMLIIALCMIIEIKGQINDKYISESSYPVQAAEYIKNNIDMSNMRLYNEYNYGSYLIYEGIPVFIDSRCDLYTPQFNKTEDYPNGRDIFTDYINTSNISRDYEKTFNEYDITHIILYKNAKLAMLLNKDPEHYIKLYTDDHFVIYQRITD